MTVLVSDQAGPPQAFGSFSGAWEDWCDSKHAEGLLTDAQLKKCRAWAPLCGAPYTAWGSTCRGIPYLGQNQSVWAKAASAASGVTSFVAAVGTGGLSTITTGGPAGLLDVAKQGLKGAVGAVSAAAAEIQAIRGGGSTPAPAAPPTGPLQAGMFSGGLATFLIASTIIGGAALVIEKRGTKKKKVRR